MSDIECEKCKVNKYCGTCITCEQAKEIYKQGREDVWADIEKIINNMTNPIDTMKIIIEQLKEKQNG